MRLDGFSTAFGFERATFARERLRSDEVPAEAPREIQKLNREATAHRYTVASHDTQGYLSLTQTQATRGLWKSHDYLMHPS